MEVTISKYIASEISFMTNEVNYVRAKQSHISNLSNNNYVTSLVRRV